MTPTNVRPYTDAELLARVKALDTYRRTVGIPLIIGVQSLENEPDKFDDKFYLYDSNGKFMQLTSGTTQCGDTVLKNYTKYNPKGAGIWKTEMFYPRCFKWGYMGKRECLRLNTQVWHYRDTNRNSLPEERGTLQKGNTGAHFHSIDIAVALKIGNWSAMCQVANVREEGLKMIRSVKNYSDTMDCDYALIKEW